MDALKEWLDLWVATRTPGDWALIFGGLGLLLAAGGVWAIRHAWHAGDPPYEGDRRRPAEPEPWHRDPTTGSLIVTPELEKAARAFQARLRGEVIPGDRTQVLRAPGREVGAARQRIRLPIPRPEPGDQRSLAPGWRSAVQSPTGTWRLPESDAGRHHHRRNGSPGEATRRLHPGYVAEARARVARGEDPGELPD
jgi:hypothetical protein